MERRVVVTITSSDGEVAIYDSYNKITFNEAYSSTTFSDYEKLLDKELRGLKEVFEIQIDDETILTVYASS
ncbi:MAG: hypothetical protein ACTSR0_04195 [Candidatus Asgardarchaeia archaeon]